MGSLLSPRSLARFCATRRWYVVVAWLVVFFAAGGAATGLIDVVTNENNFTNDPESARADEMLEERLRGPRPVYETVIVQSETVTVDDPAFQQMVEQITADLMAMTVVVQSATNYYQAQSSGQPPAENLVSADRHTTLIPVTLAGEFDDANDHATEYIEAVESHRGNGFEVYTVGDVSIFEEFRVVSEEDLRRSEAIGIPVALVILIIVFGALVAALVPLALGIVSIVVATGLVALIGRAFTINFFVVNMITMIGLAVGIDYTLFVVSRYREERARGLSRREAIFLTGDTAGKAVAFSGSTVVLALLGLFLMPMTIFRSLGLGAILAVVVAVVGTLTLVPAMLSLLGDRINWPVRRRYDETAIAREQAHEQEVFHAGFWGRTAHAVMARPVISVILAGGFLVLCTLPLFDIQTGQAGNESLPEGDVKTAFEILSQEFSAGLLAPVEIVVDGRRDDPAVQSGIEALSAALSQDPAFRSEAASPPQWNEPGDLALVSIPLVTDFNAPEAYDTVDQVRNQLIPEAFAGVDAEVLVTGATARNADYFEIVDDYTPIIFVFVLGLSFILLMLAFRSLVVPVKAIIMNLLSVGAAYGLLVLVFQKGYGADFLGLTETPTIEIWLPIFLFCVLFGLSMDYHVFLLSRIREHYDLTKRNTESVAYGLQATARIITGAAIIMVVVFGTFATGRIVALQQMGFGLAVAVFLDATLVRSVLVPATMVLLGDRNWYFPSWLRWLPELHIEGERPSVPTTVSTKPAGAD